MLKRFKRKGRKGKLDSLLTNVKKKVDPNQTWHRENKIGEGAMASVFKVTNLRSGVVAAGKILSIVQKDDIEEFAVEVDALSKVKHDGVVKLLDAYIYNKEFWVVLEYCAGGAFDDILIERKQGLSEEQIKSAASQLVFALDHLHTNGVLHRDIKASNLLLCETGHVRLTDFGSCSLNNLNGKRRDTFLGSPFWMSPEVIACDNPAVGRQKPSYNHKADVWSFGITIIELAECDPPWQDLPPMRALIKIVRSPAPSLEDPHIWSDDLYDFVDCCLHKEVDLRASTAELTQHPFVDASPQHHVLVPLLSHSIVEPQPKSAILAQQLQQATNGRTSVGFGFSSGEEDDEQFGWS